MHTIPPIVPPIYYNRRLLEGQDIPDLGWKPESSDWAQYTPEDDLPLEIYILPDHSYVRGFVLAKLNEATDYNICVLSHPELPIVLKVDVGNYDSFVVDYTGS